VLRRRADLERHRRSPLDAGPAAGRGAELDSACYSAKQTTCANAGGRNLGRQSRRCRRLGEQRPQALRDGSVESSGEGEELEDAVTKGRDGAPPQVPVSSTRCYRRGRRHRRHRGHCRCRGDWRVDWEEDEGRVKVFEFLKGHFSNFEVLNIY